MNAVRWVPNLTLDRYTGQRTATGSSGSVMSTTMSARSAGLASEGPGQRHVLRDVQVDRQVPTVAQLGSQQKYAIEQQHRAGRGCPIVLPLPLERERPIGR